ncbi:unnamed protein product [Cuscuta campestris]|uniref:Uncharacterized protein n=1 Tax=Cuscuta campestris TaxID=132261 RepID=A0A484KVW5_9ASTE|nr:unnamed protein product [Cuscuta campestris]
MELNATNNKLEALAVRISSESDDKQQNGKSHGTDERWHPPPSRTVGHGDTPDRQARLCIDAPRFIGDDPVGKTNMEPDPDDWEIGAADRRQWESD